MKNIYFALLMSLLAIGFYGCDNDDDSAETPVDQVTKAEVISAYADLVYQSYVDAHSDAMDMKNAIDAFVASPSAAGFTLAKNAWLTARETYGTTEAFRFAQGPIDVIGSEEGPEGLLNSWPLDEAYIDYVDQMPNAGIVNDASKTLDKATLSGLNGEGGEENVSIGYHAIEFLLWGQDLTAPAMLMPGQRPYTDYLDQASGGTAANHDRRGMYMKVCADLILDHLQLLLDQWEPGGAYRTTFLALDENEALSNMMTAIATLSKSELAGERVLVAWDNRDQEDEHSCFADNTHRDLRLNFLGIKEVYLGKNGAKIGPSIHDLVEQTDANLATEIITALDNAEDKVENTAIPFDYAISNDGERPKVRDAVTALQDLGDKFVTGGTAIGVTVGSELPE